MQNKNLNHSTGRKAKMQQIDPDPTVREIESITKVNTRTVDLHKHTKQAQTHLENHKHS